MNDTHLKKHDLYVYELPNSVLDSLNLIVFDGALREVILPLKVDVKAKDKEIINKKPISNSLRCNACMIDFVDPHIKRQHYKKDFHTFNIKRNLKSLPPVKEDEFEKMLQGEKNGPTDKENSDSDFTDDEDKTGEGFGSSDEDEIYREREDYLGNIMENEIEKLSISDDYASSSTINSHLNTRSAQIYFKSRLLQDSEVFGVYKALFTKASLLNPLESMKDWNKFTDQSTSISALFMIAGGHFAGAIVSHQRSNVTGNTRKQDETLQEQAVHFIEHKTFHRYTTRRKQGGSQSAMDQAKGKANSAGSSLRRYNEAALRIDVQNLLQDWEPYLAKCENIFIRAHNVHDRKIFTNDKVIGKLEQSLKTFPFTTTRPTIAELKRSWCELTYLKKTVKPEPLLSKKVSEATIEPFAKSQNKKEELLKEKSPAEIHTQEIVALLKKGKAPLLVAYLRKNGLSGDFILKPDSQYATTPTMLHFAAQHGLKQMVTILICNMKCNPCIKNRLDKTAWDLAKGPQTKQSFQIARHKLGENSTNWLDSHVAEPLSREQVDNLNKEEEDRQKNVIDAAIKQELETVRERQRSEAEEKKGTGRVLDTSTVYPSQNLNSLSEDQKKRLMREQRARAAEARMQRR